MTMGKSALVFGLQLLVIAGIFIPDSEAGDSRQDLIQDSVRRLLGVKPGSETVPVPARNTSLPPQYVMDLYERYRSGHAPMQGNTVRSILPIRDAMGEADVLIFNLSSIGSDEQILQSKLYLLKRRRPKSGKRRDHSNFRIKIGNLPQLTSHRFVDVSLSHKRSQWHSYDITESVVQCRQAKKDGDHLLGVTLEIKRAKGSYRLAPFRRLLKHNSQPFVLIFSEDSNNRTRGPLKMNPQNGIQDLLRSKVEHDSFSRDDYFSDQDYSSEDPSFKDRSKRSADDTNDVYTTTQTLKRVSQEDFNNLLSILNSELFKNISEQPNVDDHEVINSSLSKTKLLLNQILNSSNTDRLSSVLVPDISDDSLRALALKTISQLVTNASDNVDIENLSKVLINNMLPLEGPSKRTIHWNVYKDIKLEHQRTKRSISSTSSKESKELQDKANTFQTVEDKPGMDSNKLARRRDRQKERTRTGTHKKKNRRRHRKLPFWWTRHASKFHSKDHKNLCQRKSLVVDFTKLGWGDWVMSPKSFNAYYCSGGCNFPLTKDTNPSNHAAIQSLVHALGRNPGIPSPCCVPSHTSSLTMLYFDEYGSLVLKSYSDMIVDKCACR